MDRNGARNKGLQKFVKNVSWETDVGVINESLHGAEPVWRMFWSRSYTGSFMLIKKTEGSQKPLFPQQTRLTHQRYYAPVLQDPLKYYPVCARASQVVPYCCHDHNVYLRHLCHYGRWCWRSRHLKTNSIKWVRSAFLNRGFAS